MKLTINIKDHKAAFFIELLKSLDFVSIEEAQELNANILTPEEKQLLNQRIEAYKANPDNAMDWDHFKKLMQQ